jgi:hypothetical protein
MPKAAPRDDGEPALAEPRHLGTLDLAVRRGSGGLLQRQRCVDRRGDANGAADPEAVRWWAQIVEARWRFAVAWADDAGSELGVYLKVSFHIENSSGKKGCPHCSAPEAAKAIRDVPSPHERFFGRLGPQCRFSDPRSDRSTGPLGARVTATPGLPPEQVFEVQLVIDHRTTNRSTKGTAAKHAEPTTHGWPGHDGEVCCEHAASPLNRVLDQGTCGPS